MRSERRTPAPAALVLVLVGGGACASNGSTSSPPGDEDASAESGADAAGSPAAEAGGSSSGSSSGAPSSSSGSSSSSGAGASSSSSGADAAGARDGGAGDATLADCKSLPLCEDFESATAGGPPSATLWSVVGGSGCSGSSPYSAVIDTTQRRSGNQSLKVSGGDSCGPLVLTAAPFASLSSEVYGRFYVQFASATPLHHVAFMALGFLADGGPLGNDTKEYLQLSAEEASGTGGAAMGMLDWNYNDLTLPQKDSMGLAVTTYPSAGAWTCVEFHTSAGAGSIETWVNGAAVTGMTYIPGTTADVQGVNGGWNAGRPPLTVRSIGFGWVDFTTAANTVWFDDIALSSSRIGCTN